MAAVLLFILLLITSFGVLLYFLKPTKIEAAVEQHLTSIEDSRGLGVNPDGTTILKQDPLSSNPAVDSLIRHLPGVLGLARLIKQAGQTWGLPLRDAMLNLVERVPRADIRFLATAILLQKETGGNLAQILDKTAALARERSRLRGQLRIYTAQGRITGWILCIAPFIMFGVISLVNWNYEKILFSDLTGLNVLYISLFILYFVILVIRKVINIKI